MRRRLELPALVQSCEKSSDIPKNTIFVAYSDMHGRFPLTPFVPTRLDEDQRPWPVFQYDRETNHGAAPPRDMLFGFRVLSLIPHWKTKGGAQAAFERYTHHAWKSDSMQIPPFEQLERLTATSWLQDGNFLILVRTPRPFGSRNVIPFVRRTDVHDLQVKLLDNPQDEWASRRLAVLQDKAKPDSVHPTEASLFLTKSGTLVQGVSSRIVCTRCLAKGHHMAHTHDEVLRPSNPCQTSVWPDWMNVQPLPQEVLELPLTDDSKGFQVEIREVKAKVPLRLARQMKLRGLQVDGDVAKCGVMELDDD